jgi:pyrimidine-nucleoside phosphorylase
MRHGVAPVPVRAPVLIARKRDGEELSSEDIAWLIRGFVAGEVADYQMTAFAMAVCLRGMTVRETTALTLAMRDSGKRANLRAARGPKVDKHSTGGVGDKVSICLAPMVAACGVRVPMISGRGLAHTGGTLDKLEAIPGFRVDLPLARFERQVAKHGFALIGQTTDLAPADRRLYALRDVTATVESIPLITASILSKKLCEDLDALVLDVKVGRGAFMQSLPAARALARSIVDVGCAAGVPTTAVLTRMDAPLGRAVGNALETAEAIELLHGRGPDDLLECTLLLGVEMLMAGGRARTRAAAEAKLRAAIVSGAARKLLARVIAAQHGDARVVAEPDRLPRAPLQLTVCATGNGYIQNVDARRIAEVALALGAGRTRANEAIDPAVGIMLTGKPGDAIREGEALAVLHLRTRSQAERASSAVQSAFEIGKRRPPSLPVALETIRDSSRKRARRAR